MLRGELLGCSSGADKVGVLTLVLVLLSLVQNGFEEEEEGIVLSNYWFCCHDLIYVPRYHGICRVQCVHRSIHLFNARFPLLVSYSW